MQHGGLHAGGSISLNTAGIFNETRNEKLGERDVNRPELAAIERFDRPHHRIEQTKALSYCYYLCFESGAPGRQPLSAITN